MKDNDLVIGRQGIMDMIQYANWINVKKLIDEEGFPAQKIGNRWECRRSTYKKWHEEKLQETDEVRAALKVIAQNVTPEMSARFFQILALSFARPLEGNDDERKDGRNVRENQEVDATT